MNRSRRRLLVRSGVLLAVVVTAFLAGAVALAQSSPEFDLGCRAELTAGGKSTDYPAVVGVRLHSSVGQWNAGRTQVQGSGIIVESGYILPVGQGLGTSTAASAASIENGPAPNAIVADSVYLPTLYALKVVRFVRPCHWPWASAIAN